MSRELFDSHLAAVVRLVEQAKAAQDPNAALGFIHRARTRLDAARSMACIEADAKDSPDAAPAQAAS